MRPHTCTVVEGIEESEEGANGKHVSESVKHCGRRERNAIGVRKNPNLKFDDGRRKSTPANLSTYMHPPGAHRKDEELGHNAVFLGRARGGNRSASSSHHVFLENSSYGRADRREASPAWR